MARGFILGLVVGVVGLIACVYFYFASGRAPVAITDPDMPFEKMLAHKALHARIDSQTPQAPPIPADETNLLEGAQVYQQNCAVCHGLPGQPQSAIALGMHPKPPHLFRGTGVTDDPAWETHWKAVNGIRTTGMPGFNGRLNDTQLWQVSLLLANADKISDSVKKALAPEMPAAAQPAAPVTPEAKRSMP